MCAGVTEDRTYLFGDFTSDTRDSKACRMGVAVEADDVCDVQLAISLQPEALN